MSIDLSVLSPPAVVEVIDYESLLAARKARLLELIDDAADRASMAATLELESEPIVKLLQESCYREILLRQRINEAVRAVMLAFAIGTDLDQIGANYSVNRLLISPGNPSAIPPVAPIYESDADFRARIQLSPESYTTAGSEGSYIFHGLSADGNVKDIQAVSDTPGNVTVYVLARAGTGAASPELIASVVTRLNAEKIRPMTDLVTVLSANIVNYDITAELVTVPGPDQDVVREAALEAVTAYAESQRRIGADVTMSGIYAALHQPGVQRVNLSSPVGNLTIGTGEASYCTAITVTVAEATDV
jgi:phage-related baseplate assembly protein